MKRSIGIGVFLAASICAATLIVDWTAVSGDVKGSGGGEPATVSVKEAPAAAETAPASKPSEMVVVGSSDGPAASGLWVYRDPVTGEPGAPPPKGLFVNEGASQLSSHGVEEVRMPDGSFALRGNFQQAFHLVKSDSGELSVECVPASHLAGQEDATTAATAMEKE